MELTSDKSSVQIQGGRLEGLGVASSFSRTLFGFSGSLSKMRSKAGLEGNLGEDGEQQENVGI